MGLDQYFFAFTVVVALALVAVARSLLSLKAATGVAATLLTWLAFAGILASLGILGNGRFPGMLLVMVPVLLFVMKVAAGGARSMSPGTVSLEQLTFAQVFRVVVELFLCALAQDRLIPSLLTYSGLNFDIAIGATAPVMAYLYYTRSVGVGALIIWNIAGLVILANVVILAFLTTPGPFRVLGNHLPNIGMTQFPFIYIPAFMVPLAAALHILSIGRLQTMRKSA